MGLYFCELSSWKSVRRSEYTLKTCHEKDVVRELENDQHVSIKANGSQFPFIFFNLSGFSILLLTTPLLRVYLPYHGTIMIYRAKIISCTIRATILDKMSFNNERKRHFD